MLLETIVVGALGVNCYLLGCEVTHTAALIDPGDNAPEILGALRAQRLTLTDILATHAHFDHLLAARAVQLATGARFWMHPADRSLLAQMAGMARSLLGVEVGELPHVDGDLAASQALRFGQQTLEVRATPGHSAGGVSFVDAAGRRVFTGDALFAGSIGRTDLPGGDIEMLLAAIRSQLLTLPDDYVVLPGHGPASTIGDERADNPFLAAESYADWR
jgi:hydroxyacylglutathione hydrolase